MDKIVVLLLILLLDIQLFAKQVLILNSYSPIYLWTMSQSNSIVNTLSKNKDIDIFVEFMDTKNFPPTKANEDNLLNFLNNKYQNTQFDAVLTTDDNAINFLIKYQDIHLFQKAKIFFSGVDNESLVQTLPKDKFTGIISVKNYFGNLNIAKKLNKNLSTIFIVGDDTRTSRDVIKDTKIAYRAQKKIRFIYIDEKNLDSILKQLVSYDENSVMIFAAFADFKKNGKHINSHDALKHISAIYKKPMIVRDSGSIDSFVTNVIGCDCVDGKIKGKMLAQGLLKYFSGTPLKDITFDYKIGSNIYINEKNLNTYGLSVESLGLKKPIVVNKTTSFYTIYKKWIIFLIIGLVLFLVLAFVFLKRKQYIKIQKLNTKLKRMASTDFMTGLYNRRYFYDIAKDILNLAKRDQLNVSLLMIDIDNFKNVNDTYGHDIGDDVIILLAKKLQEMTRDSDICSRFGGEEFVVLLPKTDKNGALHIAQNIKEAIEQHVLTVSNNKQLQFTISIGVSTVLNNKDKNIDECIKRADKALYKAKNTGKNKICVY